jgi:hypothetical protein
MNNRFLPALLLAALVVPSALVSQEAGPRSFPLKWRENGSYRSVMSTKQSTGIPGGGEMEMAMGIETTMRASVGEQGGTTLLKTVYDAFEMKASMGGQELPGVADQVGDLVGKTVEMTIGPDGNVIDVSGSAFDDLRKLPGMDEGTVKQMMSFVGLYGSPEAGVLPGGQWEFRHVQHNPMVAMAMAGTYTYVGDEDIEGSRCARLSFEGTIEIEAGESAAGGADVQELVKKLGIEIGESSISGFSLYDLELGNIVRTEMDMDLSLSMTVPGVEQRQTTSVKTSMVQTLEFKGE